MLVNDIYKSVVQVLGQCSQEQVFEYLSDAIEALANKGQWDPLQAYIDLQASGNFLILPEVVEAPLRININKQPSFSRGRLFEFRQNTDGTLLGDELGFSWADRGEVPYMVNPPAGNFQVRSSGGIRVYGLDFNNKEVYDSAGNQGYEPTSSFAGPTFKTITGISKSETNGYAQLWAGTTGTGTLIGLYEPRAYEPLFRVIKLSKSASAVRMLFRRRTYRVTSMDDWIPLNSRLAIILMVHAISLWRKGQEADVAANYEAKALQLLQEEQDSRNAFSAISDETEVITVRNQTYVETDLITVGDIYDDASEVFGAVGRLKLFDRISDSIDLMASKANWDGLTGVLDINPANEHEFTLPNFVETVLKVNINDVPALGQNKWFSFHLNGNGSCNWWASYWTWRDRGEFPTFKDIKVPAYIVVDLDSAEDNNIQIRIKGWDDKGQRIFVDGEDGFVPPAVFGHTFPDTSLPKVSRIESITAQSDPKGYIRIQAVDAGSQDGTLLSVLEPFQRQTNFRRIYIPSAGSCTCQILFRKKTRRVKAMTDIIPLQSKIALVMAMKAYKAFKDGDIDNGNNYEATAVRLLEEEQAMRNPFDFPIEFDMTTAPGSVYNMR